MFSSLMEDVLISVLPYLYMYSTSTHALTLGQIYLFISNHRISTGYL